MSTQELQHIADKVLQYMLDTYLQDIMNYAWHSHDHDTIMWAQKFDMAMMMAEIDNAKRHDI
jgi:hypothetical protein